ncbi:MAG: response regulator transcription factor [Ruminococcaceae bacterium]|nr:response regulator transcription factor [Oscillospiraceae bacterium]
MIRIAVCDDSSAFLVQTKLLIDHWDKRPPNVTVELFTDGDALINAHTEKPFDIILLDIVMPLLNGIEAARELRERDKGVKIVFLSSSSEYGVESYSVKASNYLLKPLEPESFFACIGELAGELCDTDRFVTVRGADGTHRVPLSDIEYVESQGKHIVFYLAKDRKIESSEPLYAYEDTLLLEDGFYKCHRSYIVNIHRIDSYSHDSIIMRSKKHVPISRSCQKSFESTYFSVIFGKAGDDK